MATDTNLKVGRRDAAPDASAHTPGVRRGNAEKGPRNAPGHRSDGTSTARRSTGINPDARDPIDPQSPNLSPA